MSDRRRVIIENVQPSVDSGRFPAKRVVGDTVDVSADIFSDGHDHIRCLLQYRAVGEKKWKETPFTAVGNDRWEARFPVTRLGIHQFTVAAWVDHFITWQAGMQKKVDAKVVDETDRLIGAALVEQASKRAGAQKSEAAARDAEWLAAAAERLRSSEETAAARNELAVSSTLADIANAYPDRSLESRFEPAREIWVDRERAGSSAWYELFPRSTGPGYEHGTFQTAAETLSYIADLGFDVVYLPPIHPIGQTKRKGKNNALVAGPDDVGSPWAIGGKAGGHTSVHPDLGTLDDFDRLVKRAEELGMEIALDIAFQCSPDHPWVSEHPEWFVQRPDGSIQYAENPPKKYEDIYPINFESEDADGLWKALRDVFLFWIDHGVTIFRVDNPHTKAFPFWEWAIGDLRSKHPEVIFLAEAFTRPKVMYRLAKLGFTHSYTYFTWRNNAGELRAYVEELTRTSPVEFFRPSFWPNTPDILHEDLQGGERGMFISRFVLASTLSSNYGIYGPAFELLEHVPRHEGSEEYLDSEKYQVRDWNLNDPASIADVIKRVNLIRRSHPALGQTRNITFHDTDNPELLCYSKTSADGSDTVMVVVSFDPTYTQAGWVEFSSLQLGFSSPLPIVLTDLLSGDTYTWDQEWNFVQLNPHVMPAHIFTIAKQR